MKKVTSYIDLTRVKKLTKGDPVKMQKYLLQFLDLIPKKIAELKILQTFEDRERTRELIHHIGPHLVYFGVPEIIETLKYIEDKIDTISFSELQKVVADTLYKTERAIEEINNIVNKHSDNH